MTQSAFAVNTRTPIAIDGKVKYTVVNHELQGTIHTNHFVRTPPGIALRVQAIDLGEQAGAGFAIITHFETRDTYIAPLALFREKGILRNFGYGDQLILPLDYWSINGQTPAVQQKATPPAAQPVQTQEQPAEAQLALFGVVS